MREFAKSLKRLYQKSLVSREKIDELYFANNINRDEYDYIVG